MISASFRYLRSLGEKPKKITSPDLPMQRRKRDREYRNRYERRIKGAFDRQLARRGISRRQFFLGATAAATFVGFLTNVGMPEEAYASFTPNATLTVPTIAALKSLYVPGIFGSINVLGYAAAGDGGGGIFTVTQSSPGADNGGTIIWSNTSGYYFQRQVAEGAAFPAQWFGILTTGTEYTLQINNLVGAAVANGSVAIFPAITVVLLANKSIVEFSATRYFAITPYNDMKIVGVPGATTFQMAPNQSSNLAPKDINIFTSNVALSNHWLFGVIFDLNGPNNLINSLTLNCGAYQVTGNSGTITNLWMEKCQFINGVGTNQIVLAQHTIDTTLSDNCHIIDCLFHNNGLGTTDHSTVYAWCSNFWMENCRFEQDSNLSPVGFNWVAWENHGPHQWCENNTIINYVKMTNTANNWNASEGVHDIHIVGNFIQTYFNGPNIFREDGAQTASLVYDVWITDNNIAIIPGFSAGPIGIQIVPVRGVSNIFCSGNHIYATASSGYGGTVTAAAVGVNNAGEVVQNVYFINNRVEGCGYAFYARVNDGNGKLDNIVETDNTYVGLNAALSSGLTFGSLYQQGGSATIGRITSERNKHVATSGITYSWGMFLAGTIGEADIDDNIFDGMANYYDTSSISIDNTATITRSVGRQICTGTAAPTSGTWKNGDVFYNVVPSAGGPPGWVNVTGGSPGTFKAMANLAS